MKSFSLVKFFTVVSFLIVSVSWGVAKAEENKEDCIKRVSAQNKKNCADLTYPNKDYSDKNACLRDADSLASQSSECIEKRSRSEINEERKEGKADCTTAKKAYTDSKAKSREACAAFTGSKEKIGKEESCTDKVASCRGAVTGLFAPGEDDEEESSSLGILGDIIKRQMGGDKTATAGSEESCVDEPDQTKREQAVKDEKAAEKEFRREKKDLEDKIKKEADEQAKLREKEREKQDDIKKKVSEIEAENKKEVLKKEKSMREQIAQLSKSSVDVAKRIRAFNIAITAEKQKMDQERFNLNTAMLELTDEKITQRCRQQFEALKIAILDSKPVAAGSSADQKQLEALAAQFRNKGVKGASQLKSLLNLTKKTCFETEQNKINQLNLTSSQRTQSANDKVLELQNSISDENKHVQLDQENIKKIQAETDKEKTTEEQEMLKKTSNLNEELLNMSKSTEEKDKISKAQQEKLRKDIQDLIVEHNKPRGIPKSLTNFRKAEGLIRTAEDARQEAIQQCCVDKDAKDKKKNGCTALEDVKKKNPDNVDLDKRAAKPETTK